MYDVSIITVCRNNYKGLKDTIKSIMEQNIKFDSMELIIVDGNSTDDTKDYIEQVRKELKKINLKVNFKSEPDQGIYDAMNKGAQRAEGIWCLYLNAGDVFYDVNSMGILVNSLDNKYDIIYGDTIRRCNKKYKIDIAKDENELSYFHGMEFCHQSCVIKRALLINEPYSLKYRIAGDYEFFTRVFVNGAKFKHISGIVSVFSMDGISSTNGAEVLKENAEVQYQYNLLSHEEYLNVLRKTGKILGIRKRIPKCLIKIRQKHLARKVTSKWNLSE